MSLGSAFNATYFSSSPRLHAHLSACFFLRFSHFIRSAWGLPRRVALGATLLSVTQTYTRHENQFLQSNLHRNENLIEFPFLWVDEVSWSRRRWNLKKEVYSALQPALRRRLLSVVTFTIWCQLICRVFFSVPFLPWRPSPHKYSLLEPDGTRRTVDYVSRFQGSIVLIMLTSLNAPLIRPPTLSMASTPSSRSLQVQ